MTDKSQTQRDFCFGRWPKKYHEEKRRYKCANPEGPVSNINCPEDDPYCNCPAKELIPKDAFVIYKEDPKIVGFQGENLTEDDSLGGIDFNPEKEMKHFGLA